MTDLTARPRVNGDVSFWFAETAPGARRERLDRDLQADVVFVGAGYTSLWGAYYLKQAKPELDIVILERETAGFGASSRNGGWLSYGLPGQASRYAKSHGKQSVVDFQREIFGTIDEVLRVAAVEGIDADLAKDGEIAIATNAAQRARLRAEFEGAAEWGFGADDLRWVEGRELDDFARLEGGTAGLWSPHCARVQPAKLARGLADAVERMGVRIYENTGVSEIRPREAVTVDGHTVRADYIVRGTEGFTPSLKGQKRDWLPKLSSMIVTEPLGDRVIDEIFWSSSVMVRDAAHFFCYIHKTAENRIALGGPGVPYLWGSRTDDHGKTAERSVRELHQALLRLFPMLADARIDHTWTGVLGIPRDWSATVSVDHEQGVAVAGGYVGDGVSSTNLAGRTLRDLILREDTELTRMPWVNKRIRKWEPEPLRWVALNGMYSIYSLADRLEARSDSARTSFLATAANIVTGRH
ncbi:NAD(P)/FAD-dependent oxidoreductase [Ruicaihuangia caeni]|uniref:FAD-dependent oxidoreductase n=1 Tax=Ruicaihuangia caeni TaxID=3042517 RepID=A0AAW6T9T4_9MICO|nr:FAD-dependent oxidoreductase [Klugiella sp. YN-L-19]MDI2098783.1 FAD-dependent oxidoreductase [Klugiella sp. YN-L-19]